MLILLRELGADPLSSELLRHACRHGSLGCVRYMVESGMSVDLRDACDETVPLFSAIDGLILCARSGKIRSIPVGIREVPGGHAVSASFFMKPPKTKRTQRKEDFAGYGEPIGTVVKLHPEDTVRVRLAVLFFRKEMFSYFEQVSSGQCGWGVSFNAWLSLQGWELVGRATYKRVAGMEDMVHER
jgi:hypothetical protein